MECEVEILNLENNVVSKINEELGDDLQKLIQNSEIESKLEEQKKQIENSLLLKGSDLPPKISTALKHLQEILEKIKKLSEQHENLDKSVQVYKGKVHKVKTLTSEYINKINTLEKACDYIGVVKEIEELSDGLESSVNEKNEKKQIHQYVLLKDLYLSLSNTNCSHLYSFINEMIHYWHNILKDKFIVDFEEILKILKWPFVGNVITPLPATETISRFQVLVEYLLQIEFLNNAWGSVSDSLSLELPSTTLGEYILIKATILYITLKSLRNYITDTDKGKKKEPKPSGVSAEFEPLSLPMSQLIKPLKKRFIYHFMGKKQTNRADKPEWYFTQILTWIREHQDFIVKYVQPVYSKFPEEKVPAKVEFMRGLVQITVEKLHFELPHLHYDDSLFSHCVDEALGFDKELKNSFGYPPVEPGVIEVLTQAQIFVKWISMEKRFTLEKMDMILTSPTAFKPLVSKDMDENCLTECGNSFLTLLSTLTERYEMLPQPGHKLQFLQLQLDLIDDFRVRLLQKLHEENSELLDSHFPNILNTVSYVRDVLEEWGVNTTFLHLQYYKAKLESKSEAAGNVFQDYLDLLGKMKEDLLKELLEYVFLEVKAKSMPYRKEKWHAMEPIKDSLKPTITATACPMFQVLITKLHQLQKVLASSLFKQCWEMLAQRIDQYLYEEIVAICVFNEGGASQFTYDITKNLFPLFGQYSNKPETKFKLLKDSCVVLSMAKGLALTLKQAITEKHEDGYDASEVLADVGVYNLSKGDVLSILSRMTDLD